ncbi:MAG TPA: hypothetical protein VJC12_02375 [Candidatus Paceibacterota bacterium]
MKYYKKEKELRKTVPPRLEGKVKNAMMRTVKKKKKVPIKEKKLSLKNEW